MLCMELLEYIFKFIPHNERAICKEVCRRWRDVIKEKKMSVRVKSASVDLIRLYVNRHLTADNLMWLSCKEGSLYGAMVAHEKGARVNALNLLCVFNNDHYDVLVWALSLQENQRYLHHNWINTRLPVWANDWLYRNQIQEPCIDDIQKHALKGNTDHMNWAFSLRTPKSVLFKKANLLAAKALLSAGARATGYYVARNSDKKVIMYIVQYHKGKFPYTVDMMRTAVWLEDKEMVTHFRKEGCPWNDDVTEITAWTQNVSMFEHLRSFSPPCPCHRERLLHVARVRNQREFAVCVLKHTNSDAGNTCGLQ